MAPIRDAQKAVADARRDLSELARTPARIIERDMESEKLARAATPPDPAAGSIEPPTASFAPAAAPRTGEEPAGRGARPAGEPADPGLPFDGEPS